MLDAFRNLLAAYDHLTGRYECLVVTGRKQEACFQIRREVFGDELKRWGKNQKHCPASVDDLDEKSIQIACRDKKTGQMVGCMRITAGIHFISDPESQREYHLASFPKDLWNQVYVASRLTVLPSHRKSVAGLLLASKAYELGLNLGTVVCTMVCEPNLYPMYRRLGYRPLDRVAPSPFGGYRLPLFLMMHDYDYLRHCDSPFLKVARGKKFPFRPEGFQWWHSSSVKKAFIDPGFALIPPSESEKFHSFITRGLSSKGKTALMRHAISIRCCYGDRVIAKGGGDRNIGFVKKGAVEIRNRNQTLAILGEGDVFGEIAFILNVPRTADVIAATAETEVVLLSLSALKRLKSVADQAKIWKNLADLLARRLMPKAGT